MQHGRYTVIRKLAEGGMAEIFLATQHGSQGFEKPVVLKRIHASLYADEQFRNMLIDEAHISMGLSHNNIVQVLDLGQAQGRYFLVLELVDGWDLGRLLRRASDAGLTLPPELGLYVVAQVCRALGYAHAKTNAEGRALGIVHRDVSPQNVLVSEQGEVKLADFGIAKARRKRENTEAGVVKGKIAFMSPEQAMGQELDARSDLYSLGTMLYSLTVGKRPFEASTDLEVLLRVQSGRFTPPAEACPDLHPAIVTLLERAMQFDREQRYHSADEMLADVESVLRAAFGSPGQTELKHWLGELSRMDGQLPIGRSPPGAVPESLAPGAEFGSGDDLVLGEASIAPASPRTPARGETLVRLTGSEPTVADLRIGADWIEQETPRAIRSTQPSRLTGLAVLLVVLAVMGGAAAGLWRYTARAKAAADRESGAATEAKSVSASATAAGAEGLPAVEPREPIPVVPPGRIGAPPVAAVVAEEPEALDETTPRPNREVLRKRERDLERAAPAEETARAPAPPPQAAPAQWPSSSPEAPPAQETAPPAAQEVAPGAMPTPPAAAPNEPELPPAPEPEKIEPLHETPAAPATGPEAAPGVAAPGLGERAP